jgi:SAM-dependent methyltransferase
MAASPDYEYEYHAANRRQLYANLPDQRFEDVLLMGGAYGHELLPLDGRVGSVTILESSRAYSASPLSAPVRWMASKPSGDITCPDSSFDLITCLGVLHHIANVSHVFGELARVLRPRGYLLLREPTVSMGDWRLARKGLTPQERGIPLHILDELIAESCLETVWRTRCVMSGSARVARRLGVAQAFNSDLWVRLDEAVCRMTIWPTVYHPRTKWQRVRPMAAAYVLRKVQPSRTN